MHPLQRDCRNLSNEVLRKIFSELNEGYIHRSAALYNLLLVSRRVNVIAKPLFYRNVAIHCGHHWHVHCHCIGFQRCLDSLVRSIAVKHTAIGVFIQTLNLTIPEHAVDAGAERWSGETLDVLLPHLPNLRKLSAFYIGEDEWPVSKLALLPNPAKLTLLAVGIVHNYPVFLKFLRTCPLLECLYVGMVADKKGRLPKVIPPHVIPALRRVHCGPDFLYFAVLEGRRIEHIDLLASDITTAILHGADMNALATPMALVRSLAVDDGISLSDVLRGDVIAPYTQLEFLAIAISDIIDIADAQAMAELWSKQIRYIYIQCEGCEPDHDDVAEAFFTFMPSLVMLDIEICPESVVLNTSPRCSRYIRGIPMEKDTEIEFEFPSCQDFQEPFWVDEVNNLIQHRFNDVVQDRQSQVSCRMISIHE